MRIDKLPVFPLVCPKHIEEFETHYKYLIYINQYHLNKWMNDDLG